MSDYRLIFITNSIYYLRHLSPLEKLSNPYQYQPTENNRVLAPTFHLPYFWLLYNLTSFNLLQSLKVGEVRTTIFQDE